MWKTSYFIVLIALVLSFAEIKFAFGACPADRICIPNPLEYQTISELIDNLINILFAFSIPIVAIMAIISAYFFLTSAGDPRRVDQAKKTLFYTIIGFTIILTARLLAAAIKIFLGVT